MGEEEEEAEEWEEELLDERDRDDERELVDVEVEVAEDWVVVEVDFVAASEAV